VLIEEIELEDEVKEKLLQHYQFTDDVPLSAMIKDDEKCIRCGLCAIICPTDAMTMERMYYVEQEIVED